MQLTITFDVPEDITSRLDAEGISKENQVAALEEAIFLHIQERFFLDEENEIVTHVIEWEE
jgi:hypothetical protein